LAQRIPYCGPSTQPNGESPANKSKENQIKPRKKAWISLDSFGRIGAFQWVAANPNKKTFFLAARVSGCASPHRIARGEIWFRSAESISRIPDFANHLSMTNRNAWREYLILSIDYFDNL
jgi:hypothetical protein